MQIFKVLLNWMIEVILGETPMTPPYFQKVLNIFNGNIWGFFLGIFTVEKILKEEQFKRLIPANCIIAKKLYKSITNSVFFCTRSYST